MTPSAHNSAATPSWLYRSEGFADDLRHSRIDRHIDSRTMFPTASYGSLAALLLALPVSLALLGGVVSVFGSLT